MTDQPAQDADALDIHPASPAEREASFHNTHDVWSRGLPLAEHVAFRLKSPLHGRAQWFVGLLDGRVVTSLAVHPLDFQLRGRPLKGFGIGSVHTLQAYRRRGLAPRLLAWVEDYRRRQGDQLSILYSDIDPNFYAALGYQLAPALCGWSDAGRQQQSLAKLPEQERANLAPFDGRAELADMAAMYHTFHGARPLSVVRSAEYWSHLFERQPEDEYFWLSDSQIQRAGYVRLKTKGTDLTIADFGFREAPENSAAAARQLNMLYSAVTALARERALSRVGGWLPQSPAARAWFDVVPRHDEIPMFKSLDPSVVVDEEALASTDCFCELDHV